MNWFQAIRQKIPRHKYAIDSQCLGDSSEFAWSNLGYWTVSTQSYPQACLQLAEQLAQAVDLSEHDQLLDLGCGQGASLKYWLDHYHTQYLEAVELQLEYVHKIQNKCIAIDAIHCGSFLNLKQMKFKQKFDVVLCIDAAYHSHLTSFLRSVSLVLQPQARLGFHYLVLSDAWLKLTWLQKLKYKVLLKAADVNISDLKSYMDTEKCLNQQKFECVELYDISKFVLGGFANYVDQMKNFETKQNRLGYLKIKITALLCQKLFKDSIIHYVQIVAVKR